MVEGSQQNGSKQEWSFDGGSEQVAAAHEPQGAEPGPSWLTKRKGDKVETIGENGAVGQVYAEAIVVPSFGRRTDTPIEILYDYHNFYFEKAS